MSNRSWVIAAGGLVVLVIGVLCTPFAQNLITSHQPQPLPLTDYEVRHNRMLAELNAKESDRVRAEARGKVDGSGGDTVSGFLAVDEAAYSEMVSAIVAKDRAALLRMGADGRVFAVEPGTPVRTVSGGIFKKRVSILSGPQAGRTGWVSN